MDRVDYPVHNLWFQARRFAQFAGSWCARCAEMHARNMLFSTDQNGSPPFVFIWLRRFLIAEKPIRNGVIPEW